MASRKERTCKKCGEKEMTFSNSAVCAKCHTIEKQERIIAENITDLLSFGYTEAMFAGNNNLGKKTYTVLAPCCGQYHTMVFGNIRSLFLKNNMLPCPECGGKERTKKATLAYIEKYGRTYDETLFNDYAARVRIVSEHTYRQFKTLLNPDNKPRGVNYVHGTYQLDHKMSIRDCFVHSIPIELAGSILNLVLIPALENTSKGPKSTLDLREWINVDLSQYDPRTLINIMQDPIDLGRPEHIAEHIQQYLNNVSTGTHRYAQRKITETANKYINIFLEYGFESVEHAGVISTRPGRSPEHHFTVSHNGRVETLTKDRLQTLMRNGLYLWPKHLTYQEFIKRHQSKVLSSRPITDEERRRRSESHKGIRLSTAAKKTLSEKKKGYTRWYHPDFPSYKQARVSPGEGWATERIK